MIKLLLIGIILLLFLIFINVETFVPINSDDYTECEKNSPDCIKNIINQDPYFKFIEEFKKKYEKKSEMKLEDFNTENSYIFPFVQKFKDIIESYIGDSNYIVVSDLVNIKSKDNIYEFNTSINNKQELFNININVTIKDDEIIKFNILDTSIPSLNNKPSNQLSDTFKLKNEYGLFYPAKTSLDETIITEDMIDNFNKVLEEKYKTLSFN